MNLAIKNSEITKMSAVNPSAFTEPVGQSCEERSGGGWGTDSDFRRKLLNLGLQAAHLLERPLGQNNSRRKAASASFRRSSCSTVWVRIASFLFTGAIAAVLSSNPELHAPG